MPPPSKNLSGYQILHYMERHFLRTMYDCLSLKLAILKIFAQKLGDGFVLDTDYLGNLTYLLELEHVLRVCKIQGLFAIAKLDDLHLLVQQHPLLGPHDDFGGLVDCLQPDFVGAALVDKPVVITVVLGAGAFEEGLVLEAVGFGQSGLFSSTLLVLAR